VRNTMLDIQGLFIESSSPYSLPSPSRIKDVPLTLPSSAPVSRAEIQSSLEKMRSLTKIFSREITFDYDEQLDRIIVKVIDKDTDSVIKEIPPAEIRNMLIRIREAVGLVIDQLI